MKKSLNSKSVRSLFCRSRNLKPLIQKKTPSQEPQDSDLAEPSVALKDGGYLLALRGNERNSWGEDVPLLMGTEVWGCGGGLLVVEVPVIKCVCYFFFGGGGNLRCCFFCLLGGVVASNQALDFVRVGNEGFFPASVAPIYIIKLTSETDLFLQRFIFFETNYVATHSR